MKTDISEHCFSCLKRKNDMICLNRDGTQMDKLSTLFSIDFSSYRIYPKYLCVECDSNLNITYNFYQRLNDTLKFLESYKIEIDILDPKVETEGFAKEITGLDSSLESDNTGEIMVIKAEHQQPVIFSQEIINSAIEDFKKNESSDCIRCGFRSVTRKALSIHIGLVHKDIAKSWCKDCNEIFEDITGHRQDQNSHKKYMCGFCSQEVNKSHVIEHLKSHAGTYRCKLCDKLFNSSSWLKKHLSFHKLFRCYNCDKHFVSSRSLNSHCKKHGSLQCETCKKFFYSNEQLNQHECSNHIEDNISETAVNIKLALDNYSETEFSCGYCQKKFKTKMQLKKHLGSHSNHLPYQCSFCHKRLKNRSRLIDHERTHTKEKPYICNVCGKGFAQKSTLLTHMRQHTGKPEGCEICGRRFCRKSELKLHLSKHAGIKPFLCPECGQAFFQTSHLTEHMKGHSHDRPYKCELCDKAFKKAFLLKSHQKIHQGEKTFKCSSCSYACFTPYRLKQHEKIHVKSVGVE